MMVFKEERTGKEELPGTREVVVWVMELFWDRLRAYFRPLGVGGEEEGIVEMTASFSAASHDRELCNYPLVSKDRFCFCF
jgi:hypothetical protein